MEHMGIVTLNEVPCRNPIKARPFFLFSRFRGLQTALKEFSQLVVGR